ncbi:TRAP transporter substrate-binding protein DctP [Bradyrhizobium sp. U87765 SZCCT0131]|uniref:TRAP transporter substrate-binding protein n=1 Tax=unclassified Bradyrhizobium TaxID=2631580 RepID=UPI001BABA7E4|nr:MULTISPECIES: TRAP transporter substrate-binding protein DctP [unclassified Bradyrhizobium]MBR1221682.1 TRAP transporter substrate-binding protein DctP [Bradyrhizobium sp. U87765 SZCCT0131]MBR1264395.1 TRAP transporter substrate-binding protein DctP [Bradyrhizobium sp. U87765 SZCCT0134]MBR1304698.1 TRAP transporter substrate-binding protein DctP [Bradyrhizobium sp. U87765 SZCCT0110]MBR1322445.1 TRAP transporter substrate-binding protein DctP [Bradyrhizobium sp. U87765 SZCCT0109]MBR1346627.1
MKTSLGWAGSLVALSLAAGVAAPAQALELKVADSFPAGHYLVRLMLKPWMDEVTARTRGAVTFSYYPNQQIGKAADLLRLTQSGVVDIGYIAPSYASDKMPLSEVAQLPEAFHTSCEGTAAYWKSARQGVLAKQEYAPNKIRLLMEVVLPPYQIYSTRQKVETLKDVQGLKLRTTGGAQDLTLRAIGSVPVRMSAPDAYESLSRGTLDGLLFPMESVTSYGLEKLVKHATDGVSFGSFIVAYSISQAAWDRLPADAKAAMDEASEAMQAKACADVDKEQDGSRQRLEQAGVTFEAIPPATRAEMKEKFKGVGKDWAAALDARGKPASAALKEFEALLAEGVKK